MIDILRAYEQAARVLETSDSLVRETVRTLADLA
jgi:flagellar basal body rod protein FlgG